MPSERVRGSAFDRYYRRGQYRRTEKGTPFKGFTLHDIKILGGNVGTLSYDDPKLVMPVPQRETDSNPNLEQNPGDWNYEILSRLN